MRQGAVWSLFISFLITTASVYAEEMLPHTRQMWVADQLVNDKTAEFKEYARLGEVDKLVAEMDKLFLAQQEAVRFLLLQQIEKEEMLITPELADYIKSLSLIPPAYQLRHIGDGYEFTTPAFAYPSIANRILRKWQYEQKILNFVLAAERKELHLETWLNEGSSTETKLREKLLIEEMDGLSPPAIEYLVEQIVQSDNKIIFWLPSNQVMTRLARESEDPRVYKLLWRMRTDKNSQQELFRLMEIGDEFSNKLIMDAASNPTLHNEVIKYLASKRPLTEEIKAFFIERLSVKEAEQATAVAQELSSQGYSSWLKMLQETNTSVNSKAIKQVTAE
ncbi:hypothetical protein [Vibrio sp. SCSIO 43137]|uniref:hypothetical protein n=1 Tax=Vibrio sp. SCSIO 43137 TaxID=3021011 RepID=UPI002307B503|nr:hypothetical protein [Vibrio sp. SCSIO 43137]WCE29654.1 hypothetical protein PK654_15300 [Vibrio sp. SCSIO 43137]